MAVNEADILSGLDLGQPKDLFTNKPDDPVLRTVQSFLTAVIAEMQRILSEQGRNASGRLSASIDPTEITIEQSVLRVAITAEDYAEFIDQGVNGTEMNFGSMFSFQPDKKMSPEAINSIGGWIPAKGVGLPEGFGSFKQLAFAIGTNVRKRGIKPTKFIENTFTTETLNAFREALTDVVVNSIIVDFKQYGDNNNQQSSAL